MEANRRFVLGVERFRLRSLDELNAEILDATKLLKRAASDASLRRAKEKKVAYMDAIPAAGSPSGTGSSAVTVARRASAPDPHGHALERQLSCPERQRREEPGESMPLGV